MSPGRLSSLPNCSSAYLERDVSTLGWELNHKARFGGVVLDEAGRVLLREPSNHFDGYHWTFAKGGRDSGEHPLETALREVLEETGYRPDVVGHLMGGFTGSYMGTVNYYFVMLERSKATAEDSKYGWETQSLQWVEFEEAMRLIEMSTNSGGRVRDLLTLEATEAWIEGHAGAN
jgi:8-oxo-dGTP pyrophosphatase MutT (NUDIX family)